MFNKKYIYLLLGFMFILFKCKKEKICSYSKFEAKRVEKLFKGEFSNDSVDLQSINLNDDVIRYRRTNNWGFYSQVITIFKRSNRYFIHYYSMNKDTRTHKRLTQIKEKELSLSEIKYINYSIKHLNCLPVILDKKVNYIDDDDVLLLIKSQKDSIGFVGSPYFYSEGIDGYYYNFNKEKILVFIGTLLKMAGAEHGKKGLVKDPKKSKNDSIKYDVYLTHTNVMTKSFKIYYRQKEIKGDNCTISVHKSDTFNLLDNIKVVETLWDGEVVVY